LENKNISWIKTTHHTKTITLSLILKIHYYKLYLNIAIITQKHILHNRPDISLVVKTIKNAFLIAISAVPLTETMERTMVVKTRKSCSQGIENLEKA
jgi:hypothetical protein